jgi:hypothetical protein
MASTIVDELRSFHEFIARKLREDGQQPPSPEECLDLWRMENPTPEEHKANLQAIREGLEDMRAGRGIPLEEFDREFRERLGLPPRQENVQA